MNTGKKECFKCHLVLPLGDFYKHSQMADGHVNKCKSCNKTDVAEHRVKNIDRIRAYDRLRGNRQTNEYLKEYRKRYPNKYKAHSMVNRAIKVGNLFKENCSDCKSDISVEAHHDDYAKPLNIRWLCSICHSQWHAKNGESPNG